MAILDADKGGFLRPPQLIQTIGRAAPQNVSTAHTYRRQITDSMRGSHRRDSERWRAKQIAYNEANGNRPTAAAQRR